MDTAAPRDEAKRPFIIPIFIPHAGCPYRCVFCNQNGIAGADALGGSPHALKDRIEAFLRYGSRRRQPAEIAFFGGNFLGMPPGAASSLLAAARPYVEKGLVDGIRFSTRPDTVDSARLALIADYPVTTVELGAQSMDDRVLAAARRGHSAEDTLRAVERLKSRPLAVGLQMMIGLPGETAEGSLESARRLARLAPDFVRIYPTVVLAETVLCDWYRRGAYRPLTLQEAVARTKEAFRIFRRSRIGVIRMGLQATEDLDAGDRVAAGPYHPAFGHLVWAALFLEAAAAALQAAPHRSGGLRLFVHPRCVSRMRGLNNENVKALEGLFSLNRLRVEADREIPEHALRLEGEAPVDVY
jgi:histone acetyltransferase (RNA polymerase elongator complex component)